MEPELQAKGAESGLLLWKLECIYAEGVDLNGPSFDSLAHQAVPSGGAVSLMPLSVGRAIQEDFFVRLVPGDKDRSMLSREHFQISAELAVSGPTAAAGRTIIPCKFWLTNIGSSWTMVDNQLLDACGKSARLRDGCRIFMGRRVKTGDSVHYAPFLQFCFSLTGSILRDAGHAEPQAVAANGAEDLAEITQQPTQDLPYQVQCAATSLVDDVIPLFLLELGGSGVREGLPMASRIIIHGPAAGGRGRVDSWPGKACNHSTSRKSGGHHIQHFTPLLIGSASFGWFWQKALSSKALQALPQEHIVFEAVSGRRNGEPSVAAEMGTTVNIRNLSAEKHVCVCCSGGVPTVVGAMECTGDRLLGCGESAPVCHGDVIVLLAEPSHSLWLCFRELSGPGSVEARFFPPTWVAGG